MLPNDNESGIVVEWLKDNVYWIAGCSGGLVVLIHILDMTWGRDANLKKWLKIFCANLLKIYDKYNDKGLKNAIDDCFYN